MRIAVRHARCGRHASQAFRTLFLQELLKRGVLAPSFMVSYSHTDADIDRTIEAVAGALEVYRRALDEGVENYLVGPAVKPVYRRSTDMALARAGAVALTGRPCRNCPWSCCPAASRRWA